MASVTERISGTKSKEVVIAGKPVQLTTASFIVTKNIDSPHSRVYTQYHCQIGDPEKQTIFIAKNQSEANKIWHVFREGVRLATGETIEVPTI